MIAIAIATSVSLVDGMVHVPVKVKEINAEKKNVISFVAHCITYSYATLPKRF